VLRHHFPGSYTF